TPGHNSLIDGTFYCVLHLQCPPYHICRRARRGSAAIRSMAVRSLTTICSSGRESLAAFIYRHRLRRLANRANGYRLVCRSLGLCTGIAQRFKLRHSSSRWDMGSSHLQDGNKLANDEALFLRNLGKNQYFCRHKRGVLKMKDLFDRRSFLKKAGSTALGAAALTLTRPVQGSETQTEPQVLFRSMWSPDTNRVWPGPEYWSNPLQDWRVHEGRLECFSPGGDRNVALLTRDVAARIGDLALGVRLGPIGNELRKRGFVGFRVGIKNGMNDYRATAIYGQGMNAGVNADGRLFIGTLETSAPRIDLASEMHLQLHARPSATGYMVSLRATSVHGEHTVETTREVPDDWLTGGIALVCSSGPVDPTPVPLHPVEDDTLYPPNQDKGGTMRFWFADWTVAGSKVDKHDERAFGPIFFTLYTVSKGTMKLSAQFPPLGNVPQTATLEIRDGDSWTSIATADLDPDAWNATFRVSSWDATRDRTYRVLFSTPDGSGTLKQHSYE